MPKEPETTEMSMTLTYLFEWVKVKYKYTNRKAQHDFLFGDNSNVCLS